jgi:hypothetical protein
MSEHALTWQNISIIGVSIPTVIYLRYEFSRSTFVLDLVYLNKLWHMI